MKLSLSNFVICVLYIIGFVDFSFGKLDRFYRLPSEWNPEMYHISLHFNETLTKQRGDICIKMTTQSSTSTITLHAQKIKIIGTPSLFCGSVYPNQNIDVKLHGVNEDQQSASYYVDREIPSGFTCYFNTSFTWNVNIAWDRLEAVGAYQPAYSKQVLLATQFEQNFARKVFPCFDEPAYKAKFAIDITVGKSLMDANTISNMQKRKKILNADGSVTHLFEDSPIMSTYLVAFAIHKYKSYEHSTTNPKVTVSGAVSKYRAQKVAKLVYDTTVLLEDKLKLDNPLEKIDWIFVSPHYVSAMENWGLITAKVGSDSKNVIIHETVHQWFGNLVTNKFWDDFWLNEGFTTYFTCWVKQKLLGLSTCFKLNYSSGLNNKLEFTKTTIAGTIWYPPLNLEPIGILYSSAAAVVRMLETVMGEEYFLNAMKQYVKQFSYKAASANDLMKTFQKVSDDHNIVGWEDGKTINMTEFISNWIYQPLIPTVRVTWEDKSKQFQITQKCVLETQNQCFEQWHVPIFCNVKNKLYIVWLPKNANHTLIQLNSNDPLELEVNWNYQSRGFYMVDLEYVTANDISSRMYKPTAGDILSFHRLGFFSNNKENIQKFIASADFTATSDDSQLWYSLFVSLDSMYHEVSQSTEHSWFYHFVFSLVKKSRDSNASKASKELIRKIACRWGDPICITAALKWIDGSNRGKDEENDLYLCTLERFNVEKLRQHGLELTDESHCSRDHLHYHHYEQKHNHLMKVKIIRQTALAFAKSVWSN